MNYIFLFASLFLTGQAYSTFHTDSLPPKGKVLFNHHSFVDFSKGQRSDAGGNLYVSKKGQLQFINLYDLNLDGYPEVVTNNDHNGYDTPDAIVYQNNKPNGLQSLLFDYAKDAPLFQSFNYTMESLPSITRLPSAGGGKAVVADINLDGYKDLVFTNIIHGSTLAEMPSFIYWGGKDGLNAQRRSLLNGDRANAVAVDDITGDGLPDIVVASVGREHMYGETPNYSYEVLKKKGGEREKSSYYFEQSDAGFKADARHKIETQYALDVKIADLENNGKKSVIFLELGEPGALRVVPFNQGKPGVPQIIPVLNARYSPGFGKRITPELLVKDLNGDGFADIFVPSTGKKSEIFWSNKGKFSATNKTILETENAFSADAADLNNDGIVDLVIANCYSIDSANNYSFDVNSFVWWGSRSGFQSNNKLALPTSGAVSVKIADLNNTGRPDVLFAQHRNNQTNDVSSCVYNNSALGLHAYNRTDLQSFGAINIVADDLRNTGRKDVIIINSLSGTALHAGLNDGPGNEGINPQGLPMYIYRGNAVGAYGPANLIRVPEASQETNISFADMEDKGQADLVYLRVNAKRVAIRYNIYAYPKQNEITEIEIPFRGNTVNVADFNNDGILDILATPVNGPQGALLVGMGNRKYRVEPFDFPYMAYATLIGDVNNDGLLDAVTSGYNRVCILKGNKTGGFHFDKPEIIESDIFTTRVSLADFDNDGWLDILCQNLQNFDSKVYDIESWVLTNKKGKFSLNDKHSFHTYGVNGSSVAQLYGDGKLQFIAANYHADESRRSPTFILGGDANGFPTDSAKTRLPSYSSGANLVLDFNGDGFQDILVYNHTGATFYDGTLNPTGGTHGVGSTLFWGSAKGFDPTHTSPVPSFGPHSRIIADPGSISRRNSYELYTSEKLTNTQGGGTFQLIIRGNFSNRRSVLPEILFDNGGLKSLQSVSATATELIYSVTLDKGVSFRYQLKLDGSNSGAGPIVSAVIMQREK